MMASLVLYLADFQAGAAVEDISEQTIWRLGAYYVPLILALYLGMMAVISLYRLNQDDHEDNLRKLAASRAG
jgi:hypothetical protein